jgi:hypothetical protein
MMEWVDGLRWGVKCEAQFHSTLTATPTNNVTHNPSPARTLTFNCLYLATPQRDSANWEDTICGREYLTTAVVLQYRTCSSLF